MHFHFMEYTDTKYYSGEASFSGENNLSMGMKP